MRLCIRKTLRLSLRKLMFLIEFRRFLSVNQPIANPSNSVASNSAMFRLFPQHHWSDKYGVTPLIPSHPCASWTASPKCAEGAI